jgi:alpha-mannosidase
VHRYPEYTRGRLAQIVRGAGMTRFLTQKLSWNRFTSLPFHTFAWEGLDGSRITTRFPPADTYIAQVGVAELRRSARDYKDDGGGGPTPEMLEDQGEAARVDGDSMEVPYRPYEIVTLLVTPA